MAEQRAPRFARLQQALRRLERIMGADRENRTLWVWAVPVMTVVVTFAVLAFIGIAGAVDLFLTLPMALVLSLFLGTLSAIYLTAASSDGRDDDGPDDRGGRSTQPPPGPSSGGVAAQVVIAAPSPSSRTRTRGEPAVPSAGHPRR